MTPDEINRAIAESLNWDWYAVEKAGWYYREGGCGYTNRIEEAGRYTKEQATAQLVRGQPMCTVRIPPPNYHGDMNAIQEAVNALPDRVRDSLRWEMVNILTVAHGDKPITPIDYITATADMWAMAYVRAIGKWRDQ
jgi:uncharacterized ParB-like nuclease family protein